MTKKRQKWTAEHFSQANPLGAGQADVPCLLRRIATSLGKMGRVEVHDLVLHTDVTAEGPWSSITVYFSRPPLVKAKKRKRHKTGIRRKQL